MTIATSRIADHLFKTASKLAMRYAKHQHDADEIAQIAMIKLIRQDEKLIIADRIPFYLIRTVKNVACDFYRKQTRMLKYGGASFDSVTGVAECAEERVAGWAYSAPEPEDRQDEFTTIERAMLQLSAEHQQILQLRASGHSYKQMADMQQISIGTVRSRLHNARRRIKRLVATNC